MNLLVSQNARLQDFTDAEVRTHLQRKRILMYFLLKLFFKSDYFSCRLQISLQAHTNTVHSKYWNWLPFTLVQWVVTYGAVLYGHPEGGCFEKTPSSIDELISTPQQMLCNLLHFTLSYIISNHRIKQHCSSAWPITESKVVPVRNYATRLEDVSRRGGTAPDIFNPDASWIWVVSSLSGRFFQGKESVVHAHARSVSAATQATRLLVELPLR
jgi:hypothetical protein